jgi:uncharacterized protein (TIGR02284 family)
MAIAIDEIRSTLNGLIETLKDGEEGFRASAEKLKDRIIAGEFRTFAAQRMRFAVELQSEVSRIGGAPEMAGSGAAAMYRGWLDLKAAFTGNEDYDILAEAESGEDAALKTYREALSKDFPSDIRAIVESQFRDIVLTHNTVRAYRDAVGALKSAGGSTPAY